MPMPFFEIEPPVYTHEFEQLLTQSPDDVIDKDIFVDQQNLGEQQELIDETTAQQAFPLSGYTYPFPFTRLTVSDLDKEKGYKKFPYRTIGVLFFKIPGKGGTWRCTASVARGRWVWTAGHCVVSSSGNWYTNFTFIPGAFKDKEPYGAWKWNGRSVSLEGWATEGAFCYDIGAVRFNRKGGETLSERVGHLGFLANAPEEQHWNQFGYPSEPPFNGSKLIVSQSSLAEVDGLCGSGGPQPLGVGNDMTGGSSGGPWIVRFRNGSKKGNFINGLNSYKYEDRNQTIYGPYFGDQAVKIWDFMKANP
jgi:V8-like Glu-specific endopeptidase